MGERIRIESLEPRTKERCMEHKHRAFLEGFETLVPEFGGARTDMEQYDLFRRGRHLERGVWVADDPIHHAGIVTNARSAQDGPHARRGAYDLYPMEHGVLLTMDPKVFNHNQIEHQLVRYWLPLVRIGRELGMKCGANFNIKGFVDWGHFERPDWKTLPIPKEPEVA